MAGNKTTLLIELVLPLSVAKIGTLEVCKICFKIKFLLKRSKYVYAQYLPSHIPSGIWARYTFTLCFPLISGTCQILTCKLATISKIIQNYTGCLSGSVRSPNKTGQGLGMVLYTLHALGEIIHWN